MQFSLALNDRTVLRQVRSRLLAWRGPQRDAWRYDPMSQLVCGIISSKTRDAVSKTAFEQLRRRYRAWDDLRRAAPAEIERFLIPVTHAGRKAVYLPRALGMIVARTGSLDLDFLADWDEEMALQWLRGLPGVGPKVAATVLNFSDLRKRAMAVDTHLLRVGKKLGLLPRSTGYVAGYDLFMRLVSDDWDADDLYELHWLLKELGQRICTHEMPDCPLCPLDDLCPSAAPSTRRRSA